MEVSAVPAASRSDLRSPARLLLAPFSAPAWRATVHVLLDLPIGIATFTIFAVLVGLGFGLVWVLLIGVPIFWFALLAARGVALFERARFAALLGELIPAPALRPTKGTIWDAFVRDFSSGATWRALAYAALALPTIGVIQATLVLTFWSAGIALTVLPLYGWALPDDNVAGLDSAWSVAGWTAAGGLVLLCAPWVARGAAWIDTGGTRAAGCRPGGGACRAGRDAANQPRRAGQRCRRGAPTHRARPP
jgi:hypothetical protein